MGTFGTKISSSQLILLGVLAYLGLAVVDRAQAQQVVNPSFELPVTPVPPGYVEGPPTSPAIGWEFTTGTSTEFNHSGVQQNGSAFAGPLAPQGKQTGFINNQGSISQSIVFPETGEYQLTFQLAWGTAGTPKDQIKVSLDGNALTTATPASSSSFNTVTVDFNTTSGPHKLAFTGAGPTGPTPQAYALIDEVSIKPAVPEITKGPSDIDPTSTVELTGKHFGSDKGKIRINFPNKSKVNFANSAFPHSASKSDLYLNVPGQWRDTITSERLDSASPVGAADEQTVDITVIAANGQASKAWHARFHNKPVITGVTPSSIAPNQTFNVSGWDFGDSTGKVKIHFSNNHYHSPALNSHDDVDAHIGDHKWKAWLINATVPNVTAVVEQTVDISLTPKGGSASNTWKKKFKPRIVEQVITGNLVSVQTCSNGAAANVCDHPGSVSYTCFGIGIAEAVAINTSIATFFSTGPIGPVSLYALHIGCPIGSDSGTDVYETVVHSPWTIESVQYFDAVYQAGWQPTSSALPNAAITTNVPWETSADGGGIVYEIVITARGPQDVPLE